MARDYCNDERIIGAYINSFRMVDFMREAGISKNYAYKIRNDPRFRAVVRERKDAILKSAVNKMQSYLTKDVEILQEIIENPETSPQVKINAIQTLMSQLREWTTTTDLLKRIEALEKPSEDVPETF